MTSHWGTAVAVRALAKPPAPSPVPAAPGSPGTPGFLTPDWITSAAAAALVAVLVNTLLARRREEFDRKEKEKEKERAHVRQLEIGKTAAEYVAAVHAFQSAVTHAAAKLHTAEAVAHGQEEIVQFEVPLRGGVLGDHLGRRPRRRHYLRRCRTFEGRSP
ncbi:hypothetical protein [Streptomyces colonosanans]|nr:hypothetical protein [Streptomyces colonosanans]